MPSAAAEILDQLEAGRNDLLELLRRLTVAESPSRAAETQRPVVDILATEFRRLGMRTFEVPGVESGGQLYARPEPRDRSAPTQLLLGHFDTVWPVGTLEEMPFEVDGNVVRGPGVFDMKAGICQIVFALRALAALELEPSVLPLVFLNSDEEIGSRESTRYVRALARISSRALVMEPAMGPDGTIKTARKGVGRFTIVARGKAAHAGLDPGAGASAILELSHVIQSLFSLNDHEQGITVNVGTIDGGMSPNVVAPESRAIIDVRVETAEQAAWIEERIHSIEPVTPGVRLDIDGRIGRPPMERTPRNRALWRLARRLGDDLGLPLSEGLAGGGSDGNTTSLYTATLDGLGAVGDGAHASHEHLLVDQTLKRTALLALLILAPAESAMEQSP